MEQQAATTLATKTTSKEVRYEELSEAQFTIQESTGNSIVVSTRASASRNPVWDGRLVVVVQMLVHFISLTARHKT